MQSISCKTHLAFVKSHQDEGGISDGVTDGVTILIHLVNKKILQLTSKYQLQDVDTCMCENFH